MENFVLQVDGMKCGGCESLVQNVLKAIEGVASVKADHIRKQVAVELDPSSVSIEKIKETLVEQGYSVTV